MSETTKLPLQESLELLTVAEVRAIEKHYGVDLGDGATSTEMMAGAVWAYERRRVLREGGDLPGWDVIENWSLRDLGDYFDVEQVDFDPSEPDTPSGKGSSLTG